MHKIVLLALLVKTAQTIPFALFLAIFVFFFKKLAIKTLYETLNDRSL
jgi:hypothetical protein